MSERVRVYELARELGLSNKELITLLEAEGESVKSHSSTIDADLADLIRDKVISDRKNGITTISLPDDDESAAEEPDTSDEDAELERLIAEEEAEKRRAAEAEKAAAAPAADENPKEIHLRTPITVRDLADGLGLKPHELIGMLFNMNIFASINQVLDVEIVEQIGRAHV